MLLREDGYEAGLNAYEAGQLDMYREEPTDAGPADRRFSVNGNRILPGERPVPPPIDFAGR